MKAYFCSAVRYVIFIAATLPLSNYANAQNPDLSFLLNLLDGIEAGAWVQVTSTNSFQDVWPSEAQQPQHGSNANAERTTAPRLVIRLPSGFAWDSKRGNLILFGGGFGSNNYAGNEVYFWSGVDRRWLLASLPSQRDPNNDCLVLNGADDAPSSVAVYDSVVYLPEADRFVTLGGTTFSNAPFFCTNYVPDPIRDSSLTGPYFFDPSKFDPNQKQVGGSTGTHVDLTDTTVQGGNMWENRQTFAQPSRLVKDTTSSLSAYGGIEGGQEVIYFTGSDSFQNRFNLFRYVVGSGPGSDSVQKIGNSQAPRPGGIGFAAAAYDPNRRLFVRTHTVNFNDTPPIEYFDLTGNSGPEGKSVFTLSGEQTEFLSSFAAKNDFSIDFHPPSNSFLLWNGGTTVWQLTPPEPIATTGWQVTQLTTPASSSLPPGTITGGVWGKWKYIDQLNAFMALIGEFDGQIWLYKPNAMNTGPDTTLLEDNFDASTN